MDFHSNCLIIHISEILLDVVTKPAIKLLEYTENVSIPIYHEKTNENEVISKVPIHPTNSQVQRIEKDIRTLRDSGKSDIEIRETLGLELRTYQKYTHKIHEEDQKVWFSIAQEQLGSELIRLKNSLEHSYRIALAMSENEKVEIGERLEALNKKNDSRLSIIHLLSEFPEFIRKIQPKDLPKIESKPYVERNDWRKNGERVLQHEE